MKKIISIIAFALCTVVLSANNTPYTEGEQLQVFAPSGLKLRLEPGLTATVLDLLQYGDQVTVLNTFEFAESLQDRIDWIDGHWILVEFRGQAGYLFDGYLSSLPLPSNKDELLLDGYTYAYALSQYMDQHFAIDRLVDSSETQLSYMLQDGTAVTKAISDDYWIIEIETPSYSIHELLNLMRGMIPDRKMRSEFEHNLLFIEDRHGKISEVKIKIGDDAIIRKQKNGKVLVRSAGHVGC